mmetsp:Transcript_19437/g.42475  ORF Transcript_19437/g.42475 Transcript_19437/m.42475 type:complete len:424 (-) Transcript_19437:92-1363(-)
MPEFVQPTPVGNVDQDWAPPWGNNPGDQVVIVQAVEAYPNPIPRKCVWAMLLLSCLLVLRVQQDSTAAGGWQLGGVPDRGGPFPWEINSLASGNDTYEATLLDPLISRSSTFLQTHRDASMVVTGLAQTLLTGRSDPAEARSVPPGVSALTGSMSLAPPMCPASNATPCFVGVQGLAARESAPLQLSPSATCHRFVVGDSPSSLRPLSTSSETEGKILCLRSKRVRAVVPTGGEKAVIVAWDPVQSEADVQMEDHGNRLSCIASISLPELVVGQAIQFSWATAVLFDSGTSSLVTVGFSVNLGLLVQQFDSATLAPRWKYKLPLSVAWLLRAPRVSNGFLLFVSTEDPFKGTVLTVDLRTAEVYEQEPPPLAGGRRPQRRRLPEAVERLTEVQHGGACVACSLPDPELPGSKLRTEKATGCGL